MKSFRKRRGSAGINLGFQIAPMIDVVFVIMLFFVAMAGAVRVENALTTKLPAFVITDLPVSTPDEVTVHIDDEGQVYLNDDPLDHPTGKALPELARSLHELKAASDATKSEVLVTICADELTRYERVIDVLDALSLAKIASVTFQAGSPD